MHNAASAAGNTLDIIISRNASWYAGIQDAMESRGLAKVAVGR
jgi:hypothetical protein